MQSTIRVSLLPLCVLLVCGCAAAPPAKPDPRDPWEPMNRVIYRFNDAADRAVTKPAARAYRRVTPRSVQTGISNFLVNLGYPLVMLNDLLQAEFRPFLNDTGRLLLNSTLGIAGLLDPATAAGLDKNDRDFGQTLGKWGAKPGPYLVLPLLGPSDVRDAFGKTGDFFSDPRHYIGNDLLSYSLWGLGVVDTRAHLLDLDAVLESAYDPYAFVRNAYLQNREFKVSGGRSAREEDQEQKLLEESGVEETPPPAATPPKSPPPPE
ncbi:MAG TPA: VacJ family lipoprotein [Steroidobacteraceae bacterium]|jgi:phospholipid-binding lipoprotein MlaA|nr:VacJ family lipoprotein [Steroidobacteraceae bacterium]